MREAAIGSGADGRTGGDGQVIGGDSLLHRYVNLVKLPHTVFALPFALLGVVYASYAAPVTVRTVVLVIVAFTAARFVAMGFNRIVDRELDARNPRTRNRELPAARLSVTQAAIAVAVAATAFVGSAALLNPLCLVLSPVALAWILGYSYTKRFTALSHVWLGLGLGIAPAAGFVAVTGTWSEPWWALPAAAAAVTTWVAGFDTLYALQDEEFDRAHGLASAVVRLGPSGAIGAARALHGLTALFLVLFALGTPFGPLYYVGTVVAAFILLAEHRLVRADDLSRLNAAFFTMNGIMSVIVFLFALGDRLL